MFGSFSVKCLNFFGARVLSSSPSSPSSSASSSSSSSSSSASSSSSSPGYNCSWMISYLVTIDISKKYTIPHNEDKILILNKINCYQFVGHVCNPALFVKRPIIHAYTNLTLSALNSCRFSKFLTLLPKNCRAEGSKGSEKKIGKKSYNMQ